MKKIGVLTSGGDAPGMNAAIRAVVRTGIARGLEVAGIAHGFLGLVSGDIIPLGARSVGNIIQLGGTMLGSSRCEEFKTVEGRQKALDALGRSGVDGLVIIGGSGSQQGAHALAQMGLPVVGVASTIDNDLYGSDITIGVDTALDIALEAIDRLRVTASSHQRAFLVEVMGRKCGYLALMVGLAGGAEAIVIPEREISPGELAELVIAAHKRGKTHAMIVVAEGAQNNAQAIAAHFHSFEEHLGFDMRITTLGHVQRGGNPGAFDRVLATRFGARAVDCLVEGEHGVLVGLKSGEVDITPLEEVVSTKKELDLSLLDLARTLAQ